MTRNIDMVKKERATCTSFRVRTSPLYGPELLLQEVP